MTKLTDRQSKLSQLNERMITCRNCPRLVAWREEVSSVKRKAYKDVEYWGKPVPGFGDPNAKIFIVGLAPGAHGSNRTGRQFTGDASGNFLFPALWRAGLATSPESVGRGDGLELIGTYTAPVCRCVPPDNKPNLDEIAACVPYLHAEIDIIRPRVFVALGRVAFEQVLVLFGLKKSAAKFGHGVSFALPDGVWLLGSYHPSQQNTLTGKLTAPMFDDIWALAKDLSEGNFA